MEVEKETVKSEEGLVFGVHLIFIQLYAYLYLSDITVLMKYLQHPQKGGVMIRLSDLGSEFSFLEGPVTPPSPALHIWYVFL